MSDFEYDCLQKKKIANQARYRKRGSKSKKCNLPSDKLTQKQWKERCGPVITYNMSKPMIWDDFKKLPTSVQKEYIANLQKQYGATAVDLGGMFGVQALTVRKHVDANNLGIKFQRGRAMNSASREEWNKFLGGEETVVECVAYNNPEPAVEPSVESAETTSVAEEPAAKFVVIEEPIHTVVAAEPVKPRPMSMKKFNIQFSGLIDADMIANSLKLILGNKSEGELEIVCSLV